MNERRYPVADGHPRNPPSFTVRSLTDEELEEEILAGKGEPDYQAALLQEAERRAEAGAPS